MLSYLNEALDWNLEIRPDLQGGLPRCWSNLPLLEKAQGGQRLTVRNRGVTLISDVIDMKLIYFSIRFDSIRLNMLVGHNYL